MNGNSLTGQQVDVIFPADEIARRIAGLAGEIAAAKLERLLVVAVLKGSFMFAADLIRALHGVDLEPEVDFLTLSSYRKSTRSSGAIEILRDMELDVAGRNVLLIDDILDTGRTLVFAKDLIAARGAKRILTCVLVNKTVQRAVQLEADFKAFDCAPEYVVGYGMDVAHRYRQLPYVGRVVNT